jgi:hypothetical protein
MNGSVVLEQDRKTILISEVQPGTKVNNDEHYNLEEGF